MRPRAPRRRRCLGGWKRARGAVAAARNGVKTHLFVEAGARGPCAAAEGGSGAGAGAGGALRAWVCIPPRALASRWRATRDFPPARSRRRRALATRDGRVRPRGDARGLGAGTSRRLAEPRSRSRAVTSTRRRAFRATGPRVRPLQTFKTNAEVPPSAFGASKRAVLPRRAVAAVDGRPIEPFRGRARVLSRIDLARGACGARAKNDPGAMTTRKLPPSFAKRCQDGLNFGHRAFARNAGKRLGARPDANQTVNP
jgi:hypothetical protein